MRLPDGDTCHPPERDFQASSGTIMADQYNPAKALEVLVVEDDALLRLAAVDLVESENLVVFEADGYDQALEHLACHCQIGIVFTDIQMPGLMDGLALAHHSKARWPHLQHIIVSGQLAPTEGQMPEGARFFAKPYDTRLIGETLRKMAEIRHANESANPASIELGILP
jgi:DNA-binding NtrC family response regulator